MRKFYTIAILLIALFTTNLGAQTTYGPTDEPPEGVFTEVVGTLDDQLIGRAAGKDVTFSQMTFADKTNLYFAVLPDSVKLSLDGDVYTAAEHLVLDLSLSDTRYGKLVYTGQTEILDRRGVPVYTRFVINFDWITSPATLIPAEAQGLDPALGYVLLVEGPFHINMQFQASWRVDTGFEPHLDFYDRESSYDMKAYSSVNWGWYWENSAPALRWPVCITPPCNITAFVDEGDTVVIDENVLYATDVESDSTEVYYTVKELPVFGSLLLNGETLVLGDTISQADVADTLSYYVHDGSETTLDSAGLRLSDGDGAFYTIDEDTTFYLYIEITPVNDPPVLVTNETLELNEGEEAVIGSDLLYSTDAEGQDVTYTLDPAGDGVYPENGILKLDGVPLSSGAVFTQADIDAGKLSYKHEGTETSLDGFVFQTMDTDNHSNGDLEFFEVSITLTNDPPRLTANAPTQVTVWEKTPIKSDELAAADEESDAAHVTFVIEGGIDFGVLTLDDVQLSTGDSFTMQDILDEKVEYLVEGGSSESDYLLVEVHDEDGAVASDNGYTVFNHSILITLTGTDPSEIQPLTVYPNPGNGYFHISGSIDSYKVMSLTGQILREEVVQTQSDIILDLMDYESGLYLLLINSGEKSITKKLIIQ